MLSLHLVQRIFGTMIATAPDPEAARLVVEEAMQVICREDTCMFCDIMFAIPAAIACADVGDVADARRHLSAAQRSSLLWEGTAWQAAVLEARAHVARAAGDPSDGVRMLREAGALFEQAGQPLDAQRCSVKAADPAWSAGGRHRLVSTAVSSVE
jgi:hypothetical protein